MDYFNDFNTFLENLTAAVAAPATPTPAAPAAPTAAPAAPGTPAPAAAAPAKPGAVTSPEPAQKPATLQERLKEWIQTYSQAFKFINDRPLTTEYKKDAVGQYDMLLASIVTEKRGNVKEAISKVVDILLNKGFEGQQVLILGHTSTPGPKGREVVYNQALSERRAGIVFNAIRELSVQEKKDLSKIKFSVVGKGLTDPIIQNDKDLQPLKLKTMDGSFDAATLVNISKSLEERQKINRRVIITLPNYVEPAPVVKVAPVIVPKKVDPVAQIKPIDIKGITFFDDSYLLTKAGRETLDLIIEAVKSRVPTPQKIKQIYIAAHTEKGKGDELREKAMFILSLNRSFVVRDYLQANLPADITYVRYGCGSKVSLGNSDLRDFEDEKRVEMTFDADLPKAKEAYTELQKTYKTEATSGIIPNTTLQESITKTISSYFNDQAVRATLVDLVDRKRSMPEYCQKVPREFWLDTEYTKKGEEDPADFKSQLEKLIASLNKKYQVEIPVNSFFHRDLARAE